MQNSTGAARIKSLSFDSGYLPTGSGASGVYFSGGNSSNLILVSQTESINRIENKYAIEEIFKIDNIYNGEYGTKRFSVDFNSGITDEYSVVNVTCNIQGAKDKEFSGVTGMLDNITGQMYNAATGIFGSTTELCPIPIAFNIDTTRIITGHLDGTNILGVDGSSSITVNCSFDNSLNGTFFDYDISFSSDEQSNTTSLDINGVIKGRGVDIKEGPEDRDWATYVKSLVNDIRINGLGDYTTFSEDDFIADYEEYIGGKIDIDEDLDLGHEDDEPHMSHSSSFLRKI